MAPRTGLATSPPLAERRLSARRLARMRTPITLCLAAMLGLALVGMTAGRAAACSCAMGSEAQALADSVVAFEGVVADGPREPRQEPAGFDDTAFTFAVQEVLKGGPLPERLVIVTSLSGASCGAGFAVGQRWRVYASALDGGRLYSGLCSNNQLLDERAAIPPPPSEAEAGNADPNIPFGVWIGLAAAGAVALVSGVAFRRGGARS